MLLVLVLQFIVKKSLDLTAVIVEIEFKIMLRSNELQNFSLVINLHIDKRIVFEVKSVHIDVSGLAAFHISHGVGICVLLLNFPVTVGVLTLANNSGVDHFVVYLVTLVSFFIISS